MGWLRDCTIDDRMGTGFGITAVSGIAGAVVGAAAGVLLGDQLAHHMFFDPSQATAALYVARGALDVAVGMAGASAGLVGGAATGFALYNQLMLKPLDRELYERTP